MASLVGLWFRRGLEWIVRGEQRRTDDGMRMKRQTNYDLRSVILPPYAIRMSAKDHQAPARLPIVPCMMPSEQLASSAQSSHMCWP